MTRPIFMSERSAERSDYEYDRRREERAEEQAEDAGMSEQSKIIAELREYFEQRADGEFFPDRADPVPNEEMKLLMRLDDLEVEARATDAEAVGFVVKHDLDQLKQGHPAKIYAPGNRVLEPVTMLYANVPKPESGVPEDWWVNLIERVVPDLSPEPNQEQYPAEWALWSDRQRIRQEIATAVLCTPKPESQWIRCDNRLPKITGWYCVALADPDDIGWSTSVSWTAFWNGDDFEECDPIEDGQPVTHWMPLPKPPAAPDMGGEK